jgi:hypothetical protein
MNKRFRRGTNNIAQYRVLRPNRTSPEMIMVLLNGDKTNVQTTTSHRHGAGERSSLYLALLIGRLSVCFLMTIFSIRLLIQA